MKKLSLILLFLIAFISLKAQDAPFYNEIPNFKKQDSIKFPPKKAILFIGSSTFTNWKDVQTYFPGHVIINRGFGGSSLPNVINYVPDIVFPYDPKQIVIYCGENDFTGGATPQIVVDRVKQLIELIQQNIRKYLWYIFLSSQAHQERSICHKWWKPTEWLPKWWRRWKR